MYTPFGETRVSEEELIERVLAGDATAWPSLVYAHQEAVFRLAYLLLGDAAEAEDVAQETMVRAGRALGRFDRSRPLRPWLLQIARNQSANRKRSARRRLAALQRWWANKSPEPDTIAQIDAGAADLHLAVNQLSQADQEVIYLRYFIELTVDETAQALGVAPGTVKSRLARALQRLRPLLADRTYS
jgi:RNA polymerase sigma-70 factor (ECF subfamily)